MVDGKAIKANPGQELENPMYRMIISRAKTEINQSRHGFPVPRGCT